MPLSGEMQRLRGRPVRFVQTCAAIVQLSRMRLAPTDNNDKMRLSREHDEI
jgi:hypothetical protein